MNGNKYTFQYLHLLTINACKFYGYGFELLEINYKINNSKFRFPYSTTRALLGFNADVSTEKEGKVRKWRFNFLFTNWKYDQVIIKPKHECDWCNKLFSHEPIEYKGKLFCSQEQLDKYIEYYGED